MKIIRELQRRRPRKGTSCTVIEDGGQTYVEKEWQSGDWLFSGEYEYNVEKHIYQEANALGMAVPQLFEFDDTGRKLRAEYVEGERVETPCGDQRMKTQGSYRVSNVWISISSSSYTSTIWDLDRSTSTHTCAGVSPKVDSVTSRTS